MNHTEDRDKKSDLNSNEFKNEIYKNSLREIIRNKYNAAYEDCDVKIEAGSSKGDNYVGVIYRITVKAPEGDTLNIIAKLPPESLARREEFLVRPCFLRESEFYDVIYPIFEKFQSEKGIDVKKDGFYQIPECYMSLTEEPHEGLFLEDLKVSGFEMFDRLKQVTREHVLGVMEALGKLHALSFAIRDQKPEILEPYKTMKSVFFDRDNPSIDHMTQVFDYLKKQAMDALNLLDNEDLKNRAKNKINKDYFTMLSETVDGNLAEPYAVICHGDCWNNNIMYRYENGVPVEIRLLDWQVMRYSSPVTDLMYYIFCCTTKELRDKYYKEFMDFYHSTLTNFLRRLGSNPEKLFPRSVFDDHLLRFGKFGLYMAIMLLPAFTRNTEDIPDMDAIAEDFQKAMEKSNEIDENSLNIQTSYNIVDAYNKRMCGVFQDMYDLKYI